MQFEGNFNRVLKNPRVASYKPGQLLGEDEEEEAEPHCWS